MIKEIVFDFDGTIALTLGSSIKILNDLVVELGYQKINDEDLKVFRSEGWKKALKRINFPLWKLPKISMRVQKKLNLEIEKVKMVDGLRDVLEKLDEKFVLGILTSNSKENVEKFCKKNKLDMFRYIYSEKSLFGKEKKIKKLLKDRKLNKDEILYIGDEVRDWEACQKVGIKMIGVSWGFNSKEFLKKAGLEKIVDYIKDLNLSLILSQ